MKVKPKDNIQKFRFTPINLADYYKDKYESAKIELFDKTPIIKKPKGTRVR